MSALDEPRVLTDKYVADQIMIHLAIGDSGSISFRALMALQRLRELHRWRPIAELHEDYGSCVGVNIEDPGHVVIVHACDIVPDPNVTHFSRFTLSVEQAESMRAGLPVGAEA